MDICLSFYKKAQFLAQIRDDSLLRTLQDHIQTSLLAECEVRVFSPAMIRATTFDLSYILLRHRAWHSAPLLSEFTIDYLNSECALPRAVATTLVESSLDLLHRYTPAEIDWDASDYERAFLEHLFLSSVMAQSDADLAADIGLGRNVIELLKSAMQLTQSGEDLFQFAADLVRRLHEIIQEIFLQQEHVPWTIDLYKLKNFLQRDPYLKKSNLTPAYLDLCFQALLSCGPAGASMKALEQTLTAESVRAALPVLLRRGLVFEELQSAVKPALYRLSQKGFELTATRFAHYHLEQHGSKIDFKSLPAAYQAAVITLVWEKSVDEGVRILLSQAPFLSPEAIRILIDHVKKQQKEAILFDVFATLLQRKVHAWLRVEICRALPLAPMSEESQRLLESLVTEDPSPMVRQAARLALQRPAASGTAPSRQPER